MKDSDLSYFKKILLERKEQIKKNIEDATKEMDGFDSSNTGDEADVASFGINRTLEQSLNVKQFKELSEVERALEKMDEGIYGICEMCEEDICTKRLKVKPHAKYCIICREIYEKEKTK
ncbi:MAG: RNA polymerase-binding protein DksA [Campylobacteraceae bacterium]